jgi:hypothetical protein
MLQVELAAVTFCGLMVFPFFNRMRTDWLRGSMALALPAYQHTREVIT